MRATTNDTTSPDAIRRSLDETTALVAAQTRELERAIIGQRQVLREVLISVMAGGQERD